MAITSYTNRLIGVAATIYQWLGHLSELDQEHKGRVSAYAEAIADTLMRSSEALGQLDGTARDRGRRRDARRELGRIRGYVETMVDVLEHQLDGRKLAGVKRRLERIAVRPLGSGSSTAIDADFVDRLSEAEGYFRALADGLRT